MLGKTGEERYVELAFPNNQLYNIRLPVLIYVGYRLYNRLFFNQFLQICLFGILANVILVPIVSGLFYEFIWQMSNKKISFSFLESMMLVSVSLCMFSNTYHRCYLLILFVSVTDPMTIVEMKSNKKFFLHLGIIILGNSTLLDIFCPVAKLAALSDEITPKDVGILALGDLLDVVLGILLGCLVGIATSLMSILTRMKPFPAYYESTYESTIVVGGTLVSYFLSSYLTLQPILSVLACCLVQERYVFNNMDFDTIRAVKDSLRALAHLVQGLFFIFVGYFLANVELAAVWQPALVVLALTYVVKALVMVAFLALLNIKQKTPIKEICRDLPMLVCGGSRGPRGWAVVMHCQRTYHLPYFTDYVLFTIALSVLLDTFIFKTISQFMDVEDEGEAELETNGCCKWLASVEKNLFNLLVADTEMTRDDEFDYEVKKEKKIQKKLEQHAIHQDQDQEN